MIMPVNWVPVAYFSGLHGINGTLKINFYRDNYSISLECSECWSLDKNGNDIINFDATIFGDGTTALNIKNVNNRNSARSFLGKDIFINRNQLPEPSIEFFHFSDLWDFIIYNEDMSIHSKVLNVYNFGNGEILEIKLITEEISKNQIEMFSLDFGIFKSIDFKNKIMIINDIEYISA